VLKASGIRQTINAKKGKISGILDQQNEEQVNLVPDGKFHVRLCSAVDGRQDIVDIAKKAAVAAENQEDIKIDEESISRSLRASLGFPDPDMAVVFGWSTVMCGFQPWQTRLTEFFFVGEVRYFAWTEFASTYEKYSHRNNYI